MSPGFGNVRVFVYSSCAGNETTKGYYDRGMELVRDEAQAKED
jgi:hypothetical protein